MVEQIASNPNSVTYHAGQRVFEGLPAADEMWSLWESVEGNLFSRPEWIAPREQLVNMIERELAETAELNESGRL